MSRTWYEEYFSRWDALDVEGVLEWVTDDVVYEDTTLGHKAEGKDQMRKFVEASFRNVPDARFELVRGHDDGDAYAIEWVMHPMGVRGVSVGTLQDGRIRSNRDYWNGAAYQVPNT
jgi:ketosteroid isomerase-like protein